jgi:hypothetical protein
MKNGIQNQGQMQNLFSFWAEPTKQKKKKNLKKIPQIKSNSPKMQLHFIHHLNVLGFFLGNRGRSSIGASFGSVSFNGDMNQRLGTL